MVIGNSLVCQYSGLPNILVINLHLICLLLSRKFSLVDSKCHKSHTPKEYYMEHISKLKEYILCLNILLYEIWDNISNEA